jgi:regulator of sigma E protease
MLAAWDPLAILMTAIGVGGLIFFHELGHFLACRVTGTRVDAFSIGFGPKIFGWRRGNTVYKLSLIPLGGYVKMAAENPGEPGTGAPDEFPQKSFSAKLLIMSAGVVFNAILALLLFVWAFGLGIPFIRPQLGAASVGSAAWEAGLQRGDVVRAVNGKRILDFSDLAMAVALSSADEELDLTIDRGGDTLQLGVTPRYSERQGMAAIGVEAYVNPDAVGVTPGSPVEKAGGRKGDRILAVDGKTVRSVPEAQGAISRVAGSAPANTKEVSIDLLLRRTDGTEETITVAIPVDKTPQVGIVPYSGTRIDRVLKGSAVDGVVLGGDVLRAVNGVAVDDLHQFRDAASGATRVKTIRVERGGEEIDLVPTRELSERELAESVAEKPWSGASTRISPRAGMPADRAGIRAGDQVLTVAGKEVDDWSELHQAILKHGLDPVELVIKREDGKTETLQMQPAGRATLSGSGYLFERPLERAAETSFLGAVKLGWDRTVLNMRNVIFTVKGLLTQRVSARLVGGPIAIAQLTYRMFDLGWARYLYFLALLSINLAILNLLPIPVLDGGQIVILVAEKVRGQPLPDRVIGYLQLLGLILILGLIALALTNDITNLFR